MKLNPLGLAALVPAACVLAACSPRSEPILNPKPDIELCRADPGFQTFQINGWDGNAQHITVRFLPRATTPCPGRQFPFVDVTTAPVARWVQIVEANVPIPPDMRGKPSWQLVPGQDEPWIFLDMMEKQRGSGEPFLNASTEGTFWDNPAWPNPPDATQKDGLRKWQTHSYAVVVTDHLVRAVGGFSWGWTWAVGAKGPEPVAPEPIPRSAWLTDSARLTTAAPGWTFQ